MNYYLAASEDYGLTYEERTHFFGLNEEEDIHLSEGGPARNSHEDYVLDLAQRMVRTELPASTVLYECIQHAGFPSLIYDALRLAEKRVKERASK